MGPAVHAPWTSNRALETSVTHQRSQGNVPQETNGAIKQSVRRDLESRVGEKLPGDWLLTRVIDVGGMAGIFEASSPAGQRVAIKLMRLDVDHQEVVRDRFMLEAEILERVRHENLLKTLDQGLTLNNEPFLVMELLDGQTVEDLWIENDRRLSFPVALRVARDVLSALSTVHRMGIVHRDIKPSNIFLADGRAILFDFGVAKVGWAKDSVAVRGTILGTPAYMAPEQAMGVKDLDPRTDIFAVGATLFTLISGERLNDGESADESFIIAATTPARSLATVTPEVPLDVISLVNRTLSWERRDRFESAEDMIAAVDALLGRERELLREQEERSRKSDLLSQSALDASLEDRDLDPVVEMLMGFFQHLERLFRSVRSYGWGHSHTVRSHGMLFEHLLKVFQDAAQEGRDELALWVTPNCFESTGVPVWEPKPPFDDVPYNLFASGFRTIRFLPEISEGELLELLKLVLLDPHEDVEAEDDLATLFVERNLENVQVELVSSLENIALLEGYETFEATIQSIQQQADAAIEQLENGEVLNERALHDEAEGMSVSVARDFDLSAHERVRTMIRELMGSNRHVDFSDASWWRRLPWILGRALSDATILGDEAAVLVPLCELVTRWIDLGRFEALTSLYKDLSEAMESTQRADLAARMFSEKHLLLLLNGLGSVNTVEQTGSLGGLRQLLQDLSDGAVSVVVDALPNVRSDQVFSVLIEHLNQHYELCERRIHHLARTGDPGFVYRLLELVAKQNNEAAISALRHATRNPDRQVWLRALARRIDLEDEKTGADLIRLLESADENDRSEILALIESRSVLSTEGYLTARVTSAEFHGLSENERFSLLGALRGVNATFAEETAIELLKGQRLITNANRETSRIVAIQFLGSFGRSADCVAALRKTARSRWGTPKEIRQLAAVALETVDARTEENE